MILSHLAGGSWASESCSVIRVKASPFAPPPPGQRHFITCEFTASICMLSGPDAAAAAPMKPFDSLSAVLTFSLESACMLLF